MTAILPYINAIRLKDFMSVVPRVHSERFYTIQNALFLSQTTAAHRSNAQPLTIISRSRDNL